MMKDSLAVIQKLEYPDVESNCYTLYIDASNGFSGAVLAGVPNDKPIYYLSHQF